MKRNVASILLVGTMVMSLLAGCGSQPKETTQGGKVGEKQEIDIWYYWENEQHQEILAKELDKFNDSQEEIVAKAKYVPFADFKKQLSIGATSSELPDIAIIDGPDHASYAAMGIFADLTGKIDTEQYFWHKLSHYQNKKRRKYGLAKQNSELVSNNIRQYIYYLRTQDSCHRYAINNIGNIIAQEQTADKL